MWLGLILLALILLVGGAFGISKAIFGNRFDAEIAAIKAKGEPTTPAELAGRPIPDAENAALVYQQAIDELERPGVMPHFRRLDGLNMSSIAPNNAAKWREVQTELSELHGVLALTRRAAAMPRCRFQLDWSNDMDATAAKFMSRMRSLARIEYKDALVKAHDGSISEAVDDIVALFGMVKSMQYSPMMRPQLTRALLLSTATKALEGSLQYGGITEEQALRLFRVAGSIDIAEGFRWAWRGERVHAMRTYGPESFPKMATSAGTGSVPRPLAVGMASLYSHTLLCRDLAVYLRILNPQVDGVRLSFRQAKLRGLFDPPDTVFFGVAAIIGPARYSTEENLARTRVFLALQAHKARFGGYPASIAELKSKLGWKLPVDPFNEKDFIYKKQAKGFMLYSVGPDMKDDGGRPIQGNVVELESKGDIVLKWDR